MLNGLTKTAARNIFVGGSAVFLVIFLALTVDSHLYIVNESTDESTLSESVIHGKQVWEKNSCINCHTLLGEGAYFAPELGNVWQRYGGREDPESARENIKDWIRNQPTGIEGRRQMPKHDLTEEDLDGLVDFFEWISRINTQGWPPNDAG
jgi:nitric oxide reductase subunit C